MSRQEVFMLAEQLKQACGGYVLQENISANSCIFPGTEELFWELRILLPESLSMKNAVEAARC